MRPGRFRVRAGFGYTTVYNGCRAISVVRQTGGRHMTKDQILLFCIFGAILAGLLWGRFRHDLVAAAGLLSAVVLGLVPQEKAFSGFSNHAVVVVALVLIASHAFEKTGALGVIAARTLKDNTSVPRHVAVTGGLGAALSAVINNVAALAILMPLDMQAARKAGRPPSRTLMCLAFATILGGMVTLIGTPPNIIAAAIRKEKLGEAYGMFAFTPVGLVVALAGLAFVALVGWRLMPNRADDAAALNNPSEFQAELQVSGKSKTVGRFAGQLEEEARNADVLVLGVRREDGQFERSRWITLGERDVVIVEGSSDGIGAFMKTAELQYFEDRLGKPAVDEAPVSKLQDDESKAGESTDRSAGDANGKKESPANAAPEIIEVVVRSDSRLAGRSARFVEMRDRYGVVLLAITRGGMKLQRDIRDCKIEPGDVLLLTGNAARSARTQELLGVIAMTRVDVAPVKAMNVLLVIGLFVGALVLATSGIVNFTIAIAIAVAFYAALGLVAARDFYTKIEWPVVVMLACLLPVGEAFDRLGGTALIAQSISALTANHAPVVALVAMMVVTMTLSDVLNNVATMIITGPVAIDLALRLKVNPDTFLMGAAIAASCAFLTPIGHKNNTLIMGPGGYRFSDYWRMGLLLELLVLCVAVPMLLIVFPLGR